MHTYIQTHTRTHVHTCVCVCIKSCMCVPRRKMWLPAELIVYSCLTHTLNVYTHIQLQTSCQRFCIQGKHQLGVGYWDLAVGKDRASEKCARKTVSREEKKTGEARATLNVRWQEGRGGGKEQ